MADVPMELISILKEHNRILIAAHANPDGDAVGSSVALAWGLRDLGKDVLLYNVSGFPNYLRWLPAPSPVITRVADLPGAPGLIVALDSGDAARLGEDVQALLASVPSVNIDHHLGNPNYGTLHNWVEPNRAATGEMIGLLVKALGVDLHGPIAEAVYVSLAADTGNFAFGNTTPSTMRMAAELMENGLDLPAIRSSLDNNWSEAKTRLWGRMMQDCQLLEDGKLAVGVAGLPLFAEYGATREDTEGFVEQLRRIHGVRVALLLREGEREGTVDTKVSLRSAGPDDVRAVAAQFGGGGHKNAAGATVPLPPEKTLAVMLPYIRHVWNTL